MVFTVKQIQMSWVTKKIDGDVAERGTRINQSKEGAQRVRTPSRKISTNEKAA
jgi:hypothetical protein